MSDDRVPVDAYLRDEGFDFVRVAAAEPLAAAREQAASELEAGHLEGMDWINAAWLARSTDPGAFLPGAKSVVLVALPCHSREPAVPADGTPRGRIARYARGRDYHRVFEKRLRRVARRVREELGAAARATVDYGPLLERSFAARAGMGWLGKSTMLLVPGFGPWVLLGAIATTLELDADEPVRKSCGTCRRCVAACPTGALRGDGRSLDSRLCISYHTIESRGPIPRELRPLFGDWIFGCDLCLDSCPVGQRRFESEGAFEPATVEDARPALAPLLELDEGAFGERFRGKAIMRAKRDGFVRNVCVALGNVGGRAELEPLGRAAEDASPLVRGHAAWAIGEIGRRSGTLPEAERLLRARADSEADGGVREEIEAALASLHAERATL